MTDPRVSNDRYPPQPTRSKPRAATARSTPHDELLSINEVCEELGVARATFYRWRAHRKGPASLRLPNGTVRIRRSALTAFIAACEDATR
ncbi:helix-turn-helix transcriptional regulator [Catenulispora pinisilvae]|uniref:helix-turn-helix transcriptional regulator n=1 Tax=Catenulispora pinisilvae TaxID=2705253 RepID=UPI001890F227|nr:helix-turn-helix domain-containing protein [Catenulispora pinisilvae]